MRTFRNGLLYILVISTAILILSCTKDKMQTNGVTNLTPVAAGSILDLGAISGDVHQMSVSLSGVSMAMPSGMGDTPVLSNVSFELYTSSDGIIQDGTYTFADSGDITPFTFKSASLNTPEQSGLSLSSGTITVNRNGTNYTFTLDGTIAGGDTVSGNFDGMLLYSDSVAPY